MSVPIPIPNPPPPCTAWPGRVYLGSGGEAAVLQLKKKQNKNPAESAQTMQRSQLPSSPATTPCRLSFSVCLSVRPLGEAAAEAKFQFRGYCIFSQPLSRRSYTLCTAGCMWWGSLFIMFALAELHFFYSSDSSCWGLLLLLTVLSLLFAFLVFFSV